MNQQEHAFFALRQSLMSYASISDKTWQAFRALSSFRTLAKGNTLYQAGVQPKSYAYIYQGLIRCFVCDESGKEYNKNFFNEGMFPGSMTALLTNTPSLLAFEAIEDSLIIEINFAAYRQLMTTEKDLLLFQVNYLEKNWLLAKDSREIEIVQDNASRRYQRFINDNPNLVERLTQYHIASHLGITPTQLSRIRKKL